MSCSLVWHIATQLCDHKHALQGISRCACDSGLALGVGQPPALHSWLHSDGCTSRSSSSKATPTSGRSMMTTAPSLACTWATQASRAACLCGAARCISVPRQSPHRRRCLQACSSQPCLSPAAAVHVAEYHPGGQAAVLHLHKSTPLWLPLRPAPLGLTGPVCLTPQVLHNRVA